MCKKVNYIFLTGAFLNLPFLTNFGGHRLRVPGGLVHLQCRQHVPGGQGEDPRHHQQGGGHQQGRAAGQAGHPGQDAGAAGGGGGQGQSPAGVPRRAHQVQPRDHGGPRQCGGRRLARVRTGGHG